MKKITNAKNIKRNTCICTMNKDLSTKISSHYEYQLNIKKNNHIPKPTS